MSFVYRQHKNSVNGEWHFHRNCLLWPESNYMEISPLLIIMNRTCQTTEAASQSHWIHQRCVNSLFGHDFDCATIEGVCARSQIAVGIPTKVLRMTEGDKIDISRSGFYSNFVFQAAMALYFCFYNLSGAIGLLEWPRDVSRHYWSVRWQAKAEWKWLYDKNRKTTESYPRSSRMR